MIESAGDLPEGRVAEGAVRVIEVRAVGGVEGVGTQLPAEPLAEPQPLEKRAVEVHVDWPVDRRVPREVTKCVRRRRGEDRRIEVELSRPHISENLRVAAQVWTLGVSGGEQRRVVELKIERCSRLRRKDARYLPAVEQPSDYALAVARQRHIPNEARAQIMRTVETGAALAQGRVGRGADAAVIV